MALELAQPPGRMAAALGAEPHRDDRAASARALPARHAVELSRPAGSPACRLGRREVRLVPCREVAHPGISLAQEAEAATECGHRGQPALVAGGAVERNERFDPV